MATRLTSVQDINARSGKAYLTTWEAITASGDVGEAVQHVTARDRTVQVVGTFGSGGTVVIEGSNDGVTYTTLKDVHGTALSITAAYIGQLGSAPRYIRPRCTAGTGSIAIVVTLMEREIFE